jgi:hypothetical protein
MAVEVHQRFALEARPLPVGGLLREKLAQGVGLAREPLGVLGGGRVW